jgi:hypothetical protein
MVFTVTLALIASAIVILFLTYLSAHNTPIPKPRRPEIGCLAGVVLLLGALGLQVGPSLLKWNECSSTCGALPEGSATPAYAQGVLLEYNKCAAKAQAENARKQQALDDGVNLPNLPLEDIELETEKQTDVRCREWAVDPCVRECVEAE